MSYYRPRTIDEALTVLNRAPGAALPLSGGTDLLPRWTKGVAQEPDHIVDLKHVEGLNGVSREDSEIRVGACTLMTEIESHPVIHSAAPVLAQAAGRIACPQIRNRATIGGNLCNASPAADTAIPLLLLDAVVALATVGGDGPKTREVPIADFFRGPGSTVLASGEILTSVRFRAQAEEVFAAWDKFGTRPAMEIAVASVGVALKLEVGVITRARVGYGSVAPIPLRGRTAEAELVGNSLSREVIGKCVEAARKEITPISDVRASDAYRREVVAVMLRRLLERAQHA